MDIYVYQYGVLLRPKGTKQMKPKKSKMLQGIPGNGRCFQWIKDSPERLFPLQRKMSLVVHVTIEIYWAPTMHQLLGKGDSQECPLRLLITLGKVLLSPLCHWGAESKQKGERPLLWFRCHLFHQMLVFTSAESMPASCFGTSQTVN